MNPLMFVNWESINEQFTILCWLVAVVLAAVILAAVIPHGVPCHGAHCRVIAPRQVPVGIPH